MNIASFVDYMKARRGGREFPDDHHVAKYLGTPTAQLRSRIRLERELSNQEIKGFFDRSQKKALSEADSVKREFKKALKEEKKRREKDLKEAEEEREKALKEVYCSAIIPIIEFYPIDRVKSMRGNRSELFVTGANAPLRAQGLHTRLKESEGVYIFHDSRGRGLYVGKTVNQDLWTEMRNAYNRERKAQKTRRVKHPTRNQKFDLDVERWRQIREDEYVPLTDLAKYFSAYKVIPDMINCIEALLIRAFANDLLNKKMEYL